MSSQASRAKKPPRVWLWRILFILWLAMLAYGLPEVIAGSGRMWIMTPGVYLMAGPLYLLHFLVLVQVALFTGRTSWPALYLFGVIFGLYEAWITKVVWAGYQDSDGFAFGALGPYFGLHETIGLVLFYHAVISFLLPLAVLSRLFPAWGQHFPVPDWVFGQGRAALARRLGLLLMLGVVTGHNNPYLPEYLLTWLPFLALLVLGYLALRKTGATLPDDARAARISSPRIGPVWFILSLLWLAVLYGGSFILYRPLETPPATALLVTAALYPLLILLIARSRRQPPGAYGQQAATHPAGHPATHPATLPLRWLLAISALGAGMLLLAATGFDLRGYLAPAAFISMVPVGLLLFFWLGLWRALIRRQ